MRDRATVANMLEVKCRFVAKDKSVHQQQRRWCRTLSTLHIILTVWPTVPCHRSVTRTTNILLTKCTTQHTTLKPLVDLCVRVATQYLYVRGGQHAVKRWGRNQSRANAHSIIQQKILMLSLQMMARLTQQ